jgi:aspartate beta-hydroxylase
MPAAPSLSPQGAELETLALAAEREGRFAEALARWQALLALAPGHARALTATGFDAQRRGDLATARDLLTHAARSSTDDPTPWINVARLCRLQKDDAAEESALFQALSIDPSDLLALLLRGQLFERQGRGQEAAKAYTAATLVAPPADRLRPDLHAMVAHAAGVRDLHNRAVAGHLDRALTASHQACAGEDLSRFQRGVDIMLGRQRRFDAKPTHFYLPGVAPIEFLDRAQFPWLDAFEAGTADMRDEFLGALSADQGFTPYITYGSDIPVHQFAELNHSPRWSAYHLIKDGQVVPDAAAQCPRTLQLLAQAPQPDQPGRTPVAMFSLLKPKTRIPPHHGVSNARLVVHVPLIVPEGCGFRVGNQSRPWVPGRAWVFDDTIEHEAWNDSDQLRVILIFDIWHPSLTPAEQAMMTALSAALNEFGGMPEGYGA